MDGQGAIPGLDERGLLTPDQKWAKVMNPDSLHTQIPQHLDDVGPGWSAILLRAHEACLAANPTYNVVQVKEKFGGLRIYLVGVGFSVTGPFEEESYTTCEMCGETGHLTNHGGWSLTLCDTHEADRIREVEARKRAWAKDGTAELGDETLDED